LTKTAGKTRNDVVVKEGKGVNGSKNWFNKKCLWQNDW